MSLRHGAAGAMPVDTVITVENLLARYVELCDPASARQIKLLAEYASCPPDATTLIALTEAEHLKTQVLDKRVSLLGLLERYVSIELPFALFIDQLAELHPRYYLIASSHLTSPERVDIAISSVEGAAFSGNGDYLGACTTTPRAKIWVRHCCFLSADPPMLTTSMLTSLKRRAVQVYWNASPPTQDCQITPITKCRMPLPPTPKKYGHFGRLAL